MFFTINIIKKMTKNIVMKKTRSMQKCLRCYLIQPNQWLLTCLLSFFLMLHELDPGFGHSPDESSFFSSVPLGFFILGSMCMLIGAKYIAGQCVFDTENKPSFVHACVLMLLHTKARNSSSD